MTFAVALTGPTGMGKTALSVALAHRLRGEILSLDSMQIYRGMDIGTAKATEKEREGVPHHMLDIVWPDEGFSASDYAQMALPLAKAISARGNCPIFVGGTGLYLSTLLRGNAPTPPPSDPAAREALMALTETDGGESNYRRLCEVDPMSASIIHPNNVRRVNRALEIFDATGVPKSEWDKRSLTYQSPLQVCHITLCAHDRDAVYRRNDVRVDRMMAEGLEAEVRRLLKNGSLSIDRLNDPSATAVQAIGYKEILSYLSGNGTLSEAVDQIKLATRHYVKRQISWFSHQPDVYPLYTDREDGTLRSTADLLKEILPLLEKEMNI